MLFHLSDLHLRDASDLETFGLQLDNVVAQSAEHLVITGDLLDRWNKGLLEGALDALGARGLLDPARLTILHGNHDLASSGGHPRRTVDLWRLATRFWDPPPLVANRRRRFYRAIRRRAEGIASPAPFLKTLPSGVRLAVLDTVSTTWRPLRLEGDILTVHHAIGCVRTRELQWLRGVSGDGPLVILIHHYPLDTPEYRWTPRSRLTNLLSEVRVPVVIPGEERERFWAAAAAARTRLVLCGHVHRARLDWKDGIAVGLNGQSGAEWAGRTIASYDLSRDPLEQICQ